MSTYKELIEHLLRTHGIGIAEFSRRTGINSQSISNVVNGRTNSLRSKAKADIEKAFGVKITEYDNNEIVWGYAKTRVENGGEFEVMVEPSMLDGMYQIGTVQSIIVQEITRENLVDHSLCYIETPYGNYIRIYHDTKMTTMALFQAITPVDGQILFSWDSIKVFRIVSINYG